MFTKARIKLTGFYILIIAIIIGVFSLVLVHYVVGHIGDNLDDDPTSYQIQHKIIDETEDRLQTIILIADIIVIILAGLLSYLLAGKTLDPIQKTLKNQEQFSANASHELRTPLSVIKTENEVFLRNKQPTIQESYALATSNIEEINRMSSMVENLLVLARSKQNFIETEQTKVNIEHIINHIFSKLHAIAESKDISLISKDNGNVFVRGNQKLLEEVFFNIIQNAITYTKKGSVVVTSQIANNIIIKIQDTGIGISKNDLEHIFEPFYKADTSRTVSSAGVGLGLSIVKEIVERHKGTIKIESLLDEGTIVTVTLPALNKKNS